MYLALNKSGSGAYHRYKSTLVPFSENLLWGYRWGKGKEDLGIRLITCGNLPPLQVGKELRVHKSRMRDAVLSGRAELKGRIESASERDRRLLSEIRRLHGLRVSLDLCGCFRGAQMLLLLGPLRTQAGRSQVLQGLGGGHPGLA